MESSLLIAQLTGKVRGITDEGVELAIDPLVIEVWVPAASLRSLKESMGLVVTLHTTLQIEGNQASGRMLPRLLGFLTPMDREFFEFLCSVDGVGVRKALRAMVRPVREIARSIQDQDTAALATLPGVGEALAERIVAKLRRKVAKFALAVPAVGAVIGPDDTPALESADAQVVRETYEALLSVGHTEGQARQLLDRALAGKKKYRSVADMIDAIYKAER
jgi:Holliday junction DNA helicase RuvA